MSNKAMRRTSMPIKRTNCSVHNISFREIEHDDYSKFKGCLLCGKETWQKLERFEILENIDRPKVKVWSYMDKFKKPKKNIDGI